AARCGRSTAATTRARCCVRQSRSSRALPARRRPLADVLDLALGIVGELAAGAGEIGLDLALDLRLARFGERIAHHAPQTEMRVERGKRDGEFARSLRDGCISH